MDFGGDNDWDFDSDSLDFGGDNDWDFDSDSLDFGGDNDWDFDSDSLQLDYSDLNWLDTGDYEEGVDWDDFNWGDVWTDLDLGNVIDWGDIPWEEIIDFNIIPQDLIDYIISIMGQPFNWSNFLISQSCDDDNDAIIGGLSGIGVLVSGCSDAIPYLINNWGADCFDQITIPGLGTITPADVCCATCEEITGNGDLIEGCTDIVACNYNVLATVDDGSCNYGVECLVSPCSISAAPYIEGAYCVDDYCDSGNCCALWYYSDGNLIYNSCENEGGEESIIGFWYDFDNDQYVEITSEIINIYSFLDDEGFMCWILGVSMEYTILSEGLIQIIDPEEGAIQIPVSILDNGNLELGVDGEGLVMSPLNEFPDLDLCNNLPSNEGCEDIQGQWIYYYPGNNIALAWLEVSDSGVEMIYTEDGDLEDCQTILNLSYGAVEGDEYCTFYIDFNGFQFDFIHADLNSDGNLILELVDEDDEDFPDLWTPGLFDSSSFVECEVILGCTDSECENYNPDATEDDGSCEECDECLYDADLDDVCEDDCQDQMETIVVDCECSFFNPNTYTVFYTNVDEENCILTEDCECVCYNDVDGNGICDEDENNTGIQEFSQPKSIIAVINILGREVSSSGKFNLEIYNDGTVEKKYIIK